MKGCARLFKFLVAAGQEGAYAAYLDGPVAAIDAMAHKDDVFVELITIQPDSAGAWNHGRLFLFRDHAQRAAFAARMAQASLAFDGSEAIVSTQRVRRIAMGRAAALDAHWIPRDYLVQQAHAALVRDMARDPVTV